MSVQLVEPVVAARARRRSRWAATPRTAAITYIGAWIVGLTMFPPGPALGAPVGVVADFYASHATASVLQAGLVHGVAAVALLVVVSAMRAGGAGRAAVRAGGAAVVLSLTQFVLEIVRGGGAGSFAPATVDGLFDAVNRLDGLKMIALAVFVGANVGSLRRTDVIGGRMAVVGRVAAIALVTSGAGYLVLNTTLGYAAFVSLPLLLIWVGYTGWMLDRGGR